MTGLVAFVAGVSLTLAAQYAAHRVRRYRQERRWLRAHDQYRITVMWPPPEPAAPPGSLIIEPPAGFQCRTCGTETP